MRLSTHARKQPPGCCVDAAGASLAAMAQPHREAERPRARWHMRCLLPKPPPARAPEMSLICAWCLSLRFMSLIALGASICFSSTMILALQGCQHAPSNTGQRGLQVYASPLFCHLIFCLCHPLNKQPVSCSSAHCDSQPFRDLPSQSCRYKAAHANNSA